MKKEGLYSEETRDTKKIGDRREWEIFKGKYFKKCKPGYSRVGYFKCLAGCPLGLPDLGDKCLKKGALIVFPFVLQVCDRNQDVKGKQI